MFRQSWVPGASVDLAWNQKMENKNSESESLLFDSNFNSLEDGSFLWNDAVHTAQGPGFQTAPGTVCLPLSHMWFLAPLHMAQDCPQQQGGDTEELKAPRGRRSLELTPGSWTSPLAMVMEAVGVLAPSLGQRAADATVAPRVQVWWCQALRGWLWDVISSHLWVWRQGRADSPWAAAAFSGQLCLTWVWFPLGRAVPGSPRHSNSQLSGLLGQEQ